MTEIPQHAKALILEVVAAEEDGRRLPIRVPDAAVLREHGLIDFLGRSTKRGKEIAEEYIDEEAGGYP